MPLTEEQLLKIYPDAKERADYIRQNSVLTPNPRPPAPWVSKDRDDD